MGSVYLHFIGGYCFFFFGVGGYFFVFFLIEPKKNLIQLNSSYFCVMSFKMVNFWHFALSALLDVAIAKQYKYDTNYKFQQKIIRSKKN